MSYSLFVRITLVKIFAILVTFFVGHSIGFVVHSIGFVVWRIFCYHSLFFFCFFFTEGIWKCHHCNWTYCMGSPLSYHSQNIKGHLHMLMNVKTFNQQGLSFIIETKGQ